MEAGELEHITVTMYLWDRLVTTMCNNSMVLSKAAVSSYVNSGHRCPSIDSPDDMFLGSVAVALNWDVVHSPLFHQVYVKFTSMIESMCTHS